MSNPTGKGGLGEHRQNINRKGRPRSFDALRALAQQIAHEVAKVGDKPIIIDGHKVTIAEMILRQWAQSGKPQLQQGFIEIAFGKVPTPIEIRDWRKVAQDNGLNPDEVLNEFTRVIASRMGGGSDDRGGDTESDGAEVGAEVEASPVTDSTSG